MTYTSFLTTLASFINRKDVTSTLLDFFVNTGKNELQMANPFHFTRKLATLNYPTTPGTGVALPSDYRSMAGDYSVQFQNTNNRLIPIRGSTFENESRRVVDRRDHHRFDSRNRGSNFTDWWLGAGDPVFFVQMLSGQPTLFLNPEPKLDVTNPLPLTIYYISWIPDYNNATDQAREDFLLKYGSNILLWDAIKAFNEWSNEEFKIEVNQALRDRAFASLVEFDSRIPIDGANFDLR